MRRPIAMNSIHVLALARPLWTELRRSLDEILRTQPNPTNSALSLEWQKSNWYMQFVCRSKWINKRYRITSSLALDVQHTEELRRSISKVIFQHLEHFSIDAHRHCELIVLCANACSSSSWTTHNFRWNFFSRSFSTFRGIFLGCYCFFGWCNLHIESIMHIRKMASASIVYGVKKKTSRDWRARD